ncbi:MAG: GGDEF domain-containing protein, partial [Planctomycetota bacterium]|nr:GGDEF domain-containing protein [Planctomycetota bacterium]
ISGRELSARIRAQLRLKELNENLAASRAALQQSLRRERELLAKLRRDNAHLRVLATTDPLTHAQNVRAFQDILVHSFRVAKRYGQTLSLLMMDADHFKLINDSFGHPSGDYVLKELAVIFTQSVRESDVVARIGGEEFAVILPDADNEQAAAFAERIRAEVYARKFIVFKKHIHVTISIGSATYPSDAEITDPEMLMYFADQALLYAKEAGRDRVVRVCDLDMSVRRRMRHQYLQPPWTGQDVPELQPAME